MRISRIVVLLATASTPSLAQRGPVVALPAANGRISEEFSSIAGVRELKDGRLLISDSREGRVVVADFTKGTVTAVGRRGQGPGEYPRAAELIAMPGDSTMMPMDQGGTWVVFDGAAPPAVWIAERSIGKQRLAMIAGFDAKGNALTLTTGEMRTGVLGQDSLDAFIHERATHQDRLAGKAVSPFGSPTGEGRGARADTKMQLPAAGQRSGAGLFMMDRAMLFADGWLAIARLHPYRIDWRLPNGSAATGPVILADQVYNDNDKNAYLKREAESSGRPARTLDVTYNWPEFIPPFNGLRSTLFAAPDGKLWVGRTVRSDLMNRYDIIDRRGVLTGVLTLPADQFVAGLGTNSVYVVTMNSDGIQKLQRHPWSWGGAAK